MDSPVEEDGFEPSVPGHEKRGIARLAGIWSDCGHCRRREAHDPQHQQ